MELVALHRGSAEGLANQGVPFDAIGQALPVGFFPPARPETSAIDATGSVAAMVASIDAAARPGTEGTQRVPSSPVAGTRGCRRGRGGGPGRGAVVVVARRRARGAPPRRREVGREARPVPPPAPKRRCVRSRWPSSSTPLDAPDQCESDATWQRAPCSGSSPLARGLRRAARARDEVQLLALGDVEIEYASIAMIGGVEATAVAQPKRRDRTQVGASPSRSCRRSSS